MISNCLISNNLGNLEHGNSGHGGGGRVPDHAASAIITDCSFIGNHSNAAEGGLMLNDASNGLVSRCLIIGDSADSSGGGMAIMKSEYIPSAPLISNCTFDGNIALELPDATPAMGGGIYIQGSTPTIMNCIVSGSQGESAVCFDSSGSAVMAYCDFYNPSTDNLEGSVIPAGLGQLTGVNANGDSCDSYANILFEPAVYSAPKW